MKLWMAPGGLHIEPGLTADAAALARLHAESFFHGWSVPDFEAYLADPARTPAYVAIDARRRLAGFSMLRLLNDEAELLTIAVEKKWRGKGVGRALMQAVLDDLRHSRTAKLFLEVEEENVPAIALYKRLGFTQMGRREAYYPKPGGGRAAALTMQRLLD